MEKRALPRWKSFKEVEAFKIAHILSHPVTGGLTTLVSEEDSFRVYVDDGYMAKHQPKVGGYYVRYKDGYESFSPAEAFEEGYIKLDYEIIWPSDTIRIRAWTPKPPIGVMPQRIWKEQRIADLAGAIMRNVTAPEDAGRPGSLGDWAAELLQLVAEVTHEKRVQS